MEAQEERLLRHRLNLLHKQKRKKKDGPDFLGDMMDLHDLSLLMQGADGKINDMGGKARAVAGTIDTVMDLTSKFIPAMQKPADWWDEVSGRKTESQTL